MDTLWKSLLDRFFERVRVLEGQVRDLLRAPAAATKPGPYETEFSGTISGTYSLGGPHILFRVALPTKAVNTLGRVEGWILRTDGNHAPVSLRFVGHIVRQDAWYPMGASGVGSTDTVPYASNPGVYGSLPVTVTMTVVAGELRVSVTQSDNFGTDFTGAGGINYITPA